MAMLCRMDLENEVPIKRSWRKEEPSAYNIRSRKYYNVHGQIVRIKRVVDGIRLRGRCPSVATLDRLGIERKDVVQAWLEFRQLHVPIGTKQLKMQALVQSFI